MGVWVLLPATLAVVALIVYSYRKMRKEDENR